MMDRKKEFTDTYSEYKRICNGDRYGNSTITISVSYDLYRILFRSFVHRYDCISGPPDGDRAMTDVYNRIETFRYKFNPGFEGEEFQPIRMTRNEARLCYMFWNVVVKEPTDEN